MCIRDRISTAAGRVVYRGYNHASANGGVVYANAVSDASSANAYVGSRLAFRAQIVQAGAEATTKGFEYLSLKSTKLKEYTEDKR